MPSSSFPDNFRLRASCFNGWDKGTNTFIMVHPQFHDESMDQRLSGLEDVSDLFPGFWYSTYVGFKEKNEKSKCNA